MFEFTAIEQKLEPGDCGLDQATRADVVAAVDSMFDIADRLMTRFVALKESRD